MLLKVGAFAKLGRVSTRMLRHYDKVGLLKPIITNPITGYRFYSIDQLPRLKRICVLRDLAFTLDEIALLLDDYEPEQDLHLLLRRKQQELRQRIAQDQTRIQRIETRLHILEQEYRMEEGREYEIFNNLLIEQYGIDAVNIELVYGVGASRVYQVRQADGRIWDMYAGRTNILADDIYTTWLSGYGGHSLPDFLLSRAGLLMHLESQGYPTQRLVRTQTHTVLGFRNGWSVLVTTALPYPVTEATTENFRAMGAALGRLHTLSTEPIDSTALPVGIGWFYSEDTLHEALHYLDVAQTYIPTAWHSLVSAFQMTLQTIQQASLPRALTHGDPFIDKAVIADDVRNITLREWHSGGLGVAVLDLGRLLYACHLNAQEDWPWIISPNPERITAVLDGYTSHRMLHRIELEELLEAIQFSIAYGGAEHIARILKTGWTPKLEHKLGVRKQWFEASRKIAHIALAYFD